MAFMKSNGKWWCFILPRTKCARVQSNTQLCHSTERRCGVKGIFFSSALRCDIRRNSMRCGCERSVQLNLTVVGGRGGERTIHCLHLASSMTSNICWIYSCMFLLSPQTSLWAVRQVTMNEIPHRSFLVLLRFLVRGWVHENLMNGMWMKRQTPGPHIWCALGHVGERRTKVSSSREIQFHNCKLIW